MEKDLRQRVARIIKVARAEQDMTQAQLAEALGVSLTTVGEYERGIKLKYSLAEAMALEAALRIEDRRLLIALGYDTRPAQLGPQSLSYAGDELTREQEAEVLRYIDWLRERGR